MSGLCAPKISQGGYPVLVLSRKENESIIFGEGENRVVLTVVNIDNDRVRLGISADQKIPIYREEIYQQIQKENQNGAKNMS